MGGRCNHLRPCRSPSDRAACGGREGGARLLDAKCNAARPTGGESRRGRTRPRGGPSTQAGRARQGNATRFGRWSCRGRGWVHIHTASRVGLGWLESGARKRTYGWRRFERCLTRRFALPACLRGPSDIREPPWLAPGCVQIARRQTQSSRACLFLLSRVLDRGGSYLHD